MRMTVEQLITYGGIGFLVLDTGVGVLGAGFLVERRGFGAIRSWEKYKEMVE